jgi:Phosphotransferase enzyme family
MDTKSRLAAWVGAQLPDARDVRLHGLDRVEFGHSAETLLTTISWSDDDGDHQKDVVARIRPPAPGLLEPYDLQRQFDILRGLVHTPVRAPAPLWFEPSGDVLGREFYVMERLAGTVYEMGSSEEPPEDPDLIRRMCESDRPAGGDPPGGSARERTGRHRGREPVPRTRAQPLVGRDPACEARSTSGPRAIAQGTPRPAAGAMSFGYARPRRCQVRQLCLPGR